MEYVEGFYKDELMPQSNAQLKTLHDNYLKNIN